jgi:hypothetical protein
MGEETGEIRDQFRHLAKEAFPDDTGVEWRIKDITGKSGYFCVEAEPVPPTVGYPRFRFVLARGPGQKFRDLGCYCLDRGLWCLLYTAPDTAGEWKKLGFDAAA